MPRMTPRRDTEQLAWATSMRYPTSVSNSAARNHSRKLPRSSVWIRGVRTQAPSTSSASIKSNRRRAGLLSAGRGSALVRALAHIERVALPVGQHLDEVVVEVGAQR